MRWGRLQLLAMLLLCAYAAGQAPDLREKYGTKDAATANEIEQAVNEAQARHPREAMAHIDSALKQEPQCAAALLWKGLILNDSGDLDQASEFLRKSAQSPDAAREVTARSALELGLLLGEIDKLDESNEWLSKAIVVDEQDEFHIRWRAWKMMAQNLGHQRHNISAGWASILAYQSDPQQVDAKLPQQYLSQPTPEETLRVLFLKDPPPPEPAPRTSQSLSAVSLPGEDIPESVSGLWPDPAGRYVLAMVAPNPHYYVIAGDTLRVSRVPLSVPIACTCLTAGRLFVVSSSPSQLCEVEPESGKLLNEWTLNEPTTPSSLAVFASRNCAIYTVGDKLRRLDLTSGSIIDMPYHALLIRADPAEKFLFGMTRSAGSGLVTTRYRSAIVGGRMVSIPELIRENTSTTYLFKYLVDAQGLTPVEARADVAVNAAGIYVSPDGLGVAVPGTGGWRSHDAGTNGGYVIPVFSTDSLMSLRGVFATDPSPIGIAINPVTQQVATIRYAELRVRNPGESEFFNKLSGYNGRCAWTGNGRFLLVAYSSGGLRAFENYLTEKERRFASTWWKSLHIDTHTSPPAARSIVIAEASAMLGKFSISGDPVAVRSTLAKALEQRAVRPFSWTGFAPYSQNVEAMKIAREFSSDAGGDEQSSGVRIYKLRRAVKEHGEFAPLRFLLAEALAASGQSDAARPEYLEVIHTDLGQTDLTSRALDGLAAALHDSKQDVQAAFCLSSSLAVDTDNPGTRALLADVLELLHFDSELKQLKASSPMLASGVRIPKLPIPSSGNPVGGEVLFEHTVGSIVLIRCGDSSGTGICVGDATTILTNQHVIRSGGAVFVTPFAMVNAKTEKLSVHPAQVLYASQQQDLAILHIDQPPPTLLPLPVAAEDAHVGQRIFCIGNPGLGQKVLEQTMSEGIISATGRNIRDQDFLQHTAAVNPGNSGGPLLNERGEVVGVITLQAALENVSFAIPASRVRRVFTQQSSGR